MGGLIGKEEQVAIVGEVDYRVLQLDAPWFSKHNLGIRRHVILPQFVSGGSVEDLRRFIDYKSVGSNILWLDVPNPELIPPCPIMCSDDFARRSTVIVVHATQNQWTDKLSNVVVHRYLIAPEIEAYPRK